MVNQNPVLLSLGGNTGDTELYFKRALELLAKNGFQVMAVSSVLRNPALGCEPGAADFFNIAVLGNWEKDVFDLLKICKKIEVECGRPAEHPHWVSRTLDIDLIVCGDLILHTPELTLPHPEAAKRRFVVLPASEIAPGLSLPGTGKTFALLAASSSALS